MNIEKLKPWNWFKHEDDSATSQIPVARSEARTIGAPSEVKTISALENSTMGSLLQLHNEMDRLFNDVWQSFNMPESSRLLGAVPGFKHGLFGRNTLDNRLARLNVSGSDKDYEISVELPGLAEKDIQIELADNTLLVKGHKQEETTTKDKQYYRVERSVGTFQRTLSLPDDADQDAISANLKQGVLTIKIPRKALPHDNIKHIAIH